MKGIRRIRKILEKIEGRVLLATHKNADTDALASTLALGHYLEKKSSTSETHYYFPQGISADARKAYFNIYREKFLFEKQTVLESTKTYDYLIILDAASPSQLPGVERLIPTGKSILIDHHTHSSLRSMVDYPFVYGEAASTSEIIASVLKPSEIHHLDACMLMAGILADTSKLSRASPSTFKALEKLSKICDYNNLVGLLYAREEDVSLRIARLKAMQRMIIENVNGILVSATHIGSYESDIASWMIRLGADLAIVASSKDETRIILRARKKVAEKTSEKLLSTLTKKFGGQGGGHTGALVVSIPKRVGKRELPGLVKKLVTIAKEALME